MVSIKKTGLICISALVLFLVFQNCSPMSSVTSQNGTTQALSNNDTALSSAVSDNITNLEVPFEIQYQSFNSTTGSLLYKINLLNGFVEYGQTDLTFSCQLDLGQTAEILQVSRKIALFPAEKLCPITDFSQTTIIKFRTSTNRTLSYSCFEQLINEESAGAANELFIKLKEYCPIFFAN